MTCASANINSSDMFSFSSRRSNVFSTHGMVGSSQPLASEIGLSVLKRGGNAADAAVAMAAALNVTEPCSTGIGGDCFVLFYDAKTETVKALNGSGRAPQALSLEWLAEKNKDTIDGVDSITVPGSVAAWCDCIDMFGSKTLTMKELLTPAIHMAEEGFPVHEVAAANWKAGVELLKSASPNGHEMLKANGHAPTAGDLMHMPSLAQTLRQIAEHGKKGFYEGYVAEAIVNVIKSLDGPMDLSDLSAHTTDVVQPIKINYKGVDVWECPPNGQGLAALMALNILRHFDVQTMGHNSAEALHLMIEAMRLAFADAKSFITDPDFERVPVDELLSDSYGRARAKNIDMTKATADVVAGQPLESCDTVYFAVTDGDGNSCSFIQSNYEGFGSGVVPKGCGFTLQNRGRNFNLNAAHPNCLRPGKRPYHTIIPSMATREGKLWFTFGVMGGFMQPQGHVQTFLNMMEFNMLPQNALNAGRFCIFTGDADGAIYVEDSVNINVIAKLREMGHTVYPISKFGEKKSVAYTVESRREITIERVKDKAKLDLDRGCFGKGVIIERREGGRVLCGGADPRGDGVALGW